MCWEIKKIEGAKICQKAWRFYKGLPEGLQIFGGNEPVFIEQIQKDINFALNDGGGIKAIVNAVELGNNIVEGHIYCPRNATKSEATATVLYAKEWLFANTPVKMIVANVHRRHKGLQQIVAQAGFSPTGILCSFQAKGKSKPFRSEMWTVVRENL